MAQQKVTRVIINMSLDMTVVLRDENLIVEHETQPKGLENLYVFSVLEPPRTEKIVKPSKTQYSRQKNLLPGTVKTKLVFVDEAEMYRTTGKILAETYNHFKKKKIPGVDELSRMFTFK
jgi:hypothetical protein